MGRPSIPPGVHFRMLLVGYFEKLPSERQIAWRCADSLSLRAFLGLAPGAGSPDDSSLNRTRLRVDLETHRAVFDWVLKRLAEHELLKGRVLGVDAATLEANAAMRSIVRRETGQSYREFLADLAKASGIETPTAEDLAKFDRKRKGKKCSNDDWFNPHDPNAKVAKMKDGTTHLAHKNEHAVDLDTGAIVASAVHPADEGDTTTMWGRLEEAAAEPPGTRAFAITLPLRDRAGLREDAPGTRAFAITLPPWKGGGARRRAQAPIAQTVNTGPVVIGRAIKTQKIAKNGASFSTRASYYIDIIYTRPTLATRLALARRIPLQLREMFWERFSSAA